jgi:hypothetical protein
VLAVPPAYILSQDGPDQQECEQAASTRWLRQHAAALAPHHVTVLGDDLYSNHPLCKLALEHGFNFIFVCKPDSHATLYERLAFWQAHDGIKTLEDLTRYATDLADLPRMYNGDLAPTQEVAALGYRLMICGSTIWLIYKQLREAFEELQRTGRVNPERYGTRWDVAGLLGLDQVYELERQYGVVETPSA